MANAEIDAVLRMLYNLHKDNPNKLREELLKIYPFYSDSQSEVVLKIRKNWIESSVEDRIVAAINKEREFAELKIIPNPKNVWNWDKTRRAPPFLLPENEINADIINPILMKSMEIQASSCTELADDYILNRNGFKIHGYLMHIFNCIPGNQSQS